MNVIVLVVQDAEAVRRWSVLAVPIGVDGLEAKLRPGAGGAALFQAFFQGQSRRPSGRR